jgi:CubicO group peptidase (beta-lactamase class C family)
MSGLDTRRLARLAEVMHLHVEHDRVGGATWLLAAGDQVEVGVVGRLTRARPATVARDSIFRISSMTKPIVAVAALILVEDFKLRLDDPVDALLPELADRRVLVEARGPIDGATVAAQRPITLRDVLTFRLGMGMDFAAPWPQPFVDALASASSVPVRPSRKHRHHRTNGCAGSRRCRCSTNPASAGSTTPGPTCWAC